MTDSSLRAAIDAPAAESLKMVKGPSMSGLQKLMKQDADEARKRLERAAFQFVRVPCFDLDNLPFPARWHGRLLIMKPVLSRPDDYIAVTRLNNDLIRRDRDLQRAAKAYLEDTGVMGLLEESLQSRDKGAFRADLVDLAILHVLTEASEPQEILELGSGLSTVVLGHAAERFGGRLTCLEPSDQWAEHTSRSLPASIRSHVTVICPAVGQLSLRGGQTSAFRFEDGATPDFIYVDGAPKDASFAGLETVLKLEKDLLPGCVIAIDSRVAAVRALMGIADHGALDEGARMVARRYQVYSQGVWIRQRGTSIPVGPGFGFDCFCNTVALLTA